MYTWFIVRYFRKNYIWHLLRTLFFTEEMSESDDTAEDFSEIAVDADSTVIIIIRAKFLKTHWLRKPKGPSPSDLLLQWVLRRRWGESSPGICDWDSTRSINQISFILDFPPPDSEYIIVIVMAGFGKSHWRLKVWIFFSLQISPQKTAVDFVRPPLIRNISLS